MKPFADIQGITSLRDKHCTNNAEPDQYFLTDRVDVGHVREISERTPPGIKVCLTEDFARSAQLPTNLPSNRSVGLFANRSNSARNIGHFPVSAALCCRPISYVLANRLPTSQSLSH